MKKIYNPNRLIIDQNKIRKNIKNIKNYIGNNVEIMPIIKANAYGVGVKNIISILKDEDIENVGVATTHEAIEVRKYFKGQILILLQPMVEQIEQIIANNIIVNACSIDFIYELNRKSREHNKVTEIHIEIDTGMGRTGVLLNEINRFIMEVDKLENIKVIGVSTHLSSSGSDDIYTMHQIEKFNLAIDIIKKRKKIKLKYIHIYSSGAILKYPIKYSNMVRTGIMLYGYYPNNFKSIELYPALTLKSNISYIHELKKGECVGYNKVYRASRNMKVATIPMGFADAFMGLESNVGYSLIKGYKAKIIAICMDTMIIDITDIDDVKINDEVVLWDNKNITLEQWGDWTNTSNYEVLSILSNRIDKIVEKNK